MPLGCFVLKNFANGPCLAFWCRKNGLVKLRGRKRIEKMARAFRLSGPAIATIASFATIAIALYCSKRKGAREATWLGVFCFAWALGAGTWLREILKSGRYRNGFRMVTREYNPIEFWISCIFGCIVVVGFVVVGILLMIGLVAMD